MAEGFLDRISVFGRIYDITSKCDTELNENSENSVQNKIITEKFNQTDETLEELENRVSNIIPIEIENIDDLFGL